MQNGRGGSNANLDKSESGYKKRTWSSNSPPSAIESQLQRSSATLPVKYAKKAGPAFLTQTGPEKMTDGRLRSRCSGFSPEPPLEVRFQKPAGANGRRSQSEHSAKGQLGFYFPMMFRDHRPTDAQSLRVGKRLAVLLVLPRLRATLLCALAFLPCPGVIFKSKGAKEIGADYKAKLARAQAAVADVLTPQQ